jgi:hypothetical protein
MKVLISVADPACLSRILDQTFFHHGSEMSPAWIPDPHQRIEVYKPQKKQNKWFLSSKKYNTGCSSATLVLHHFSQIKSQINSQNSGNQGFPYYFFLTMEGSESVWRRPKNMWTQWVRIRNTEYITHFRTDRDADPRIRTYFKRIQIRIRIWMRIGKAQKAKTYGWQPYLIGYHRKAW